MEKRNNKIILTEEEYQNLINSNPLTGLPGNKIIEKVIKEKFLNSKNFFLIYFDISDFKTYNDIYGFEKGDLVIKEVAKISKNSIKEDEFLGHIGGDDFVAMIREENLNFFIEKIFSEFKRKIPDFYTKDDFERGFIITFNREGFREKIKLLGITAVGFKNEGKFKNPFEVAEFGAILKKKAKSLRRLKPDNFIFLKEAKKEFLSIKKIIEGDYPLNMKRSLIEAIGETKDVSYLYYFIDLLKRKDIHYLIKKSLIFSIGQMQEKKVADVLVEFSKSENPHLRMRSIEAIGNLGLIELEEIVKERLNDENKYVKIAAIKTAGILNLKGFVKKLKDFLNDRDKQIETTAIISLAELQEKEIIPKLFKILEEENDISLKKASLRAIGNLGGEEEFNKLLNYYKKLDFKLKIELLMTLRTIIENNKVKKTKIEIFKEILNSKSWRIRRLTVEILSFFKNNEEVKNILIDLIKKEKTDLVRARALLSLRNFPSKESTSILRKHLKEEIPIIKENCIIALSEIGTKRELNDLRILLKDENEKIREISAQAIINILKRRN